MFSGDSPAAVAFCRALDFSFTSFVSMLAVEGGGRLTRGGGEMNGCRNVRWRALRLLKKFLVLKPVVLICT